MNIFSKLGILSLGFALIGCGGSSSSESVSALSADQKAELETVAKDVKDSRSAMSEAGNYRKLMVSEETPETDGAWGDVSFGSCEITGADMGGDMGGDTDGPPVRTSSTGDMSMEVTGDNCPVYYKMSMEMGTTGGMKISFEMEIKNADLKEKVDVTKMKFTAEMKMTGESVSFEGDGSMTSKKYGDVTMALSGSGSMTENTMTETIKFPDYTVEYKTVTAGDKNTYFLNGEEVSESDFEKYRIEMMSDTQG